MHAFVCVHMYLVVCMPHCTYGSQRTTYKVSTLQQCEFQVSLPIVRLGSRSCLLHAEPSHHLPFVTVRGYSQVYCYNISSAQGWLLQQGPWSQPLFPCVSRSSHSSESQISRLAGSCDNANTSATVHCRHCCTALHCCEEHALLRGTWPAVQHMCCCEERELLRGPWAAVWRHKQITRFHIRRNPWVCQELPRWENLRNWREWKIPHYGTWIVQIALIQLTVR